MKMPSPKILISLPVLLAAMELAGCQQTDQSTRTAMGEGPAQVDLSQRPDPTDVNGQPGTPDAILSADPSATRLQDIGGMILLYYRDHHQLPQSLEQLASSPGGDSLNLAAPRSGREFAYEPNGLWSDAHPDKCIIAYDPDLRGAVRYCLLIAPPVNNAPLITTVVMMAESDFRKYHPPIQ